MILKKDILIKDITSPLTIIKPYGKALVTEEFKRLVENIYSYKVIIDDKTQEYYNLKINILLISPNGNNNVHSNKVKSVLDKTCLDLGDFLKVLDKANTTENFKDCLLILNVFKFPYVGAAVNAKFTNKTNMGPYVLNAPKNSVNYTGGTNISTDIGITTDFTGEFFFFNFVCSKFKFSFKK